MKGAYRSGLLPVSFGAFRCARHWLFRSLPLGAADKIDPEIHANVLIQGVLVNNEGRSDTRLIALLGGREMAGTFRCRFCCGGDDTVIWISVEPPGPGSIAQKISEGAQPGADCSR